MPRGIKGSGQKPATKKTTTATTEQKTRKPYPSHDERLVAVEAQIGRLTKLNEERAMLIAETEAKLNKRKAALNKSEEALKKAIAKQAKIVAAMEKAAKPVAPKLSPEERAEKRKEALAKAREVRKTEKAKMDALIAALAEQGKSVDDLLAEIKK